MIYFLSQSSALLLIQIVKLKLLILCLRFVSCNINPTATVTSAWTSIYPIHGSWSSSKQLALFILTRLFSKKKTFPQFYCRRQIGKWKLIEITCSLLLKYLLLNIWANTGSTNFMVEINDGHKSPSDADNVKQFERWKNS